MGYRLKILEEAGDGFEEVGETERLSGTTVAGREDEAHEYTDRDLPVDDPDNYASLRDAGALGHYSQDDIRKVSRNHFAVRETADGETVEDLNSTNGTRKVGTYEGNNVYQAGGVLVAVEHVPDFYVGFEYGPDLRGTKNDIHDMADTLRKRRFDTSLAEDATWNDVTDRIQRVAEQADEESTTVIQYAGHGTRGEGRLVLNKDGTDDRKEYVAPKALINVVDRVPGKKVLIIDECYAGNFKDEDIPNDMTVLASSAEDESAAETYIGKDFHGRYTGRLIQQLEEELGGVNMEDVHAQVAANTKVAQQGATSVGNDIYVTGIKESHRNT